MTTSTNCQWFDKIYWETLPDVQRCALSYLRPYPDLKAEADDLIQETYIRMFESRERLYERSDIVKWLVVTLRHLISNRLRVRQTHRKHNLYDVKNDEMLENMFVDPCTVTDQVFADDDQEKLEQIAERIGKDKLELLAEYYLDKVPLEELAKRENISPDAMKMRISRLRKKCISILILIFLLEALLIQSNLHIGNEGYGNQQSEKFLFRARSFNIVDGRDEQIDRPNGYGFGQRTPVLSLSGKRGGRSCVH